MKMKEMEEEATKLKQYQADVEEDMNLSSSSLPGVQSPQFLSQDEKKEIDARSIYVGNVRFFWLTKHHTDRIVHYGVKVCDVFKSLKLKLAR